jgi:hypothetical protein
MSCHCHNPKKMIDQWWVSDFPRTSSNCIFGPHELLSDRKAMPKCKIESDPLFLVWAPLRFRPTGDGSDLSTHPITLCLLVLLGGDAVCVVLDLLEPPVDEELSLRV